MGRAHFSTSTTPKQMKTTTIELSVTHMYITIWTHENGDFSLELVNNLA